MTAYTTAKLTGAEMSKGMRINGREIESVRNGVGSGKIWTYVTYVEADANGSKDGRFRRNTVRVPVEVPAPGPAAPAPAAEVVRQGWFPRGVERAEAEAYAEDTQRDAGAFAAQTRTWLDRHAAGGRDARPIADLIKADHAEALIEDTERGGTADLVTMTDTELVAAIEAARAEVLRVARNGRRFGGANQRERATRRELAVRIRTAEGLLAESRRVAAEVAAEIAEDDRFGLTAEGLAVLAEAEIEGRAREVEAVNLAEAEAARAENEGPGGMYAGGFRFPAPGVYDASRN